MDQQRRCIWGDCIQPCDKQREFRTERSLISAKPPRTRVKFVPHSILEFCLESSRCQREVQILLPSFAQWTHPDDIPGIGGPFPNKGRLKELSLFFRPAFWLSVPRIHAYLLCHQPEPSSDLEVSNAGRYRWSFECCCG